MCPAVAGRMSCRGRMRSGWQPGCMRGMAQRRFFLQRSRHLKMNLLLHWPVLVMCRLIVSPVKPVCWAHIWKGRISMRDDWARSPHSRAIRIPNSLQSVCADQIVKLVTLAPEIEGGLDAIRAFAKAGIAVQIGHTDADYETACAALDAGARGFTHLFNAMSALHHRAPGVAGAALARAEYAAVIPDGVHVADGALLAALRAIPKLFMVTDATAAAGMPDGTYPLGSHMVTKRGDSVFLDDETLAGSALTMDAAFARLLALGLPVEEASLRLSRYPADFIGRWDRGRIAERCGRTSWCWMARCS